MGVILGNLTSKICNHSMPILTEKNIVTVNKSRLWVNFTIFLIRWVLKEEDNSHRLFIPKAN